MSDYQMVSYGTNGEKLTTPIDRAVITASPATLVDYIYGALPIKDSNILVAPSRVDGLATRLPRASWVYRDFLDCSGDSAPPKVVFWGFFLRYHATLDQEVSFIFAGTSPTDVKVVTVDELQVIIGGTQLAASVHSASVYRDIIGREPPEHVDFLDLYEIITKMDPSITTFAQARAKYAPSAEMYIDIGSQVNPARFLGVSRDCIALYRLLYSAVFTPNVVSAHYTYCISFSSAFDYEFVEAVGARSSEAIVFGSPRIPAFSYSELIPVDKPVYAISMFDALAFGQSMPGVPDPIAGRITYHYETGFPPISGLTVYGHYRGTVFVEPTQSILATEKLTRFVSFGDYGWLGLPIVPSHVVGDGPVFHHYYSCCSYFAQILSCCLNGREDVRIQPTQDNGRFRIKVNRSLLSIHKNLLTTDEHDVVLKNPSRAIEVDAWIASDFRYVSEPSQLSPDAYESIGARILNKRRQRI